MGGYFGQRIIDTCRGFKAVFRGRMTVGISPQTWVIKPNIVHNTLRPWPIWHLNWRRWGRPRRSSISLPNWRQCRSRSSKWSSRSRWRTERSRSSSWERYASLACLSLYRFHSTCILGCYVSLMCSPVLRCLKRGCNWNRSWGEWAGEGKKKVCIRPAIHLMLPLQDMSALKTQMIEALEVQVNEKHLRQQLEEKDREIHRLRATPSALWVLQRHTYC